MSGMDDLIPWLRKQIAMDEQTARAMSHAIENLQSRWSPARLIADATAKRKLIEELAAKTTAVPSNEEDRDWVESNAEEAKYFLRVIAETYAGCRGYREEWRP